MPERTIDLHPLDVDDNELLRLSQDLMAAALQYGIDLGEESANLLVRYLLYVLQVNSYINLTAVRDVDRGLILHLLDSLLYLKLLPSSPKSLLDMGSGPGFPGVPLSVVLGCRTSLLDSVGKKMKADDAILQQLGISCISPIHDRIESFAKAHRGSFDVVVARALAPLPVLLEYARPLLANNGSLVVSKGDPDQSELERAESLCQTLGFKPPIYQSFDLPDGYGHRLLIRFDVYKPCSLKLPRKIGLASKEPLA